MSSVFNSFSGRDRGRGRRIRKETSPTCIQQDEISGEKTISQDAVEAEKAAAVSTSQFEFWFQGSGSLK